MRHCLKWFLGHFLYPFFYEVRQTADDFPAYKDFINVAHVKHVNYSAKIRLAAIPPSVPSVNHQVVKDMNSLRAPKFLNFHAIQKCLVDSISNTTAKSGCVVVFLHFPNGHGVDDRRKCSIHSASKGSEWQSFRHHHC